VNTIERTVQYSDAIAVTLWDRDGTLLFSSRWTGSRTLEQELSEGSVRIR
jgi:hypothetical protein